MYKLNHEKGIEMDQAEVDRINNLWLEQIEQDEMTELAWIGAIVNALLEAAVDGKVTVALVMGPDGVKVKESGMVVASGKDFDELYKNLKKLSKNDSCNSCDSWQENGGNQ